MLPTKTAQQHRLLLWTSSMAEGEVCIKDNGNTVLKTRKYKPKFNKEEPSEEQNCKTDRKNYFLFSHFPFKSMKYAFPWTQIMLKKYKGIHG